MATGHHEHDRMVTSLGDQLARSLRVRVLVLAIAAFVAVAIPAGLAFQWIVGATTLKLGTLFAEKQILYDRHRGLGTLMREVALAETLARSPIIIDWAANEANPESARRGLAELEHYRLAFSDHSYFFVVDRSGNYYFNDREGSYTGNQFRYTLSPDNPRDGWYYTTAAGGPGCQLNVDNDDVLSVTKVWINCVVEQDGRTLGILGTGIDLSVFISTVVNSDQLGIESMFVDRNGAVQANRDASKIDFHSLTKEIVNRKTVFQMLPETADRVRLQAMMDHVRGEDLPVAAEFMRIGGRNMLVGIGYLDRLGWYNVTVMDVDAIIDRRLFGPIAALLLLVMVAAATLVTYLFKRGVLDRLARTEASISRIGQGDFGHAASEEGRDEIARLAKTVNGMARAVRSNRESLENAVRERTEKLERIAYLDPLTGILNRRGAAEAFEQVEDRGAVGFLIVDIDRFKEINDSLGHRAGDAIVIEVADRLMSASPPGTFCARWGGDEFVVLIPACSEARLRSTARGLLEAVGSKPVDPGFGSSLSVTPSIGGHLARARENLDAVAHKADLALYRAKRTGRNRCAFYDPAMDASAADERVA
jgi:diguanylate cyclase (GGDEF)-like protein